MKRIIFALFVPIFLILFGCKKDGESCDGNNNASTIYHDGLDREYILYVPSSYDGNSSVPMVLNFHGYGGTATNFIQDADMRQQAEADTFILVYPQGSCLEGSSHWNACPNGGDNKSSTDDLGFIETLIDHLDANYNIDEERVYAVGYSNGGMMAYGLANYRSEKIAAVGSVSGTMLDCIGPTSHPMPVIHLHGTSDGVLPYNGGSDFNSAQFVLNHWINFNNTNSAPITNSSGSIDHYLYDQGDSSVSVEHYKYNGGGHDWFSSTYQGKTTSQLVWDFFSKYDINGLR